MIYRTPYPNELCHHGIKGQKWGVRRYQNSDGTLTAAGKKHYKSVDYANKIRSKAEKEEPKITSDVIQSVKKTTASMYGLENKLKTKQSLKRKIETDSKNDGINLKESASKIKDSIRYTALSNDRDFTKNYFQIKRNLEDKGYSEVRCKNYFDLYNKGIVKHKSVQSVFESPNGQIFELQFHTNSSQDAKNKKIPLYEEARDPNISPKRLKQLEIEMDVLASKVPTPKDVYLIKTHG